MQQMKLRETRKKGVSSPLGSTTNFQKNDPGYSNSLYENDTSNQSRIGFQNSSPRNSSSNKGNLPGIVGDKQNKNSLYFNRSRIVKVGDQINVKVEDFQKYLKSKKNQSAGFLGSPPKFQESLAFINNTNSVFSVSQTNYKTKTRSYLPELRLPNEETRISMPTLRSEKLKTEEDSYIGDVLAHIGSLSTENRSQIQNFRGLPKNGPRPVEKCETSQIAGQDRSSFTVSPFDGKKLENKLQKLLQKRINTWSENYKEFLRKIFPSSEKAISQIITFCKLLNDKLTSRYVLFPDTEYQLLELSVGLESTFLKMLGFMQIDSSVLDARMKEMEELLKKEKINGNMLDEIARGKIRDFELELKSKVDERTVEFGELSRESRNLMVQQVRMEKELEVLSKRLIENEDAILREKLQSDLAKYKQALGSVSEKAIQDQLRLRNIIKSYDLHMMNSDQNVRQFESEVKRLSKENEEQKKKLYYMEEELRLSKERENEYRETAGLAKEDYDTTYRRQNELVHFVNAFREKLSKIELKMEHFNLKLVNSIPTEQVKRDKDIVRNVLNYMNLNNSKTIYDQLLKEGHKSLHSMIESSRIINYAKEEESPAHSSPGKKKASVDTTEKSANINTLQYFKPSFFTFIEIPYKELKIKENQGEFEKKVGIQSKLLGTIRGILDSKYNEFLLSPDYKTYSRFPDFVYSWLGTFRVTDNLWKVDSIEGDSRSKIDDVRTRFYIDLYDLKLDKIWEINTFREFLEERSSIDEIYFFLRCRSLLFKGPQLGLFSAGSFDLIHYVRFDHLEIIIETVFEKFDKGFMDFLRKVFYEKVKVKNGVKLIDSGFILRIFLEYYRNERSQRLRIIKELFMEFSESYQTNVLLIRKFDKFKQILSLICPKCTELEKAEIYRECFSLGKGDITPEILFTVCSEKGFFIKTLNLNDLMSSAIQKAASTHNRCKYDDTHDLISLTLNRKKGILAFLKKQVSWLGNEAFLEEFLKIEELFLEENKIVDVTNYTGHGLLGTLWLLIEKLIQSRRCLLVQKIINKAEEEYEASGKDLSEMEGVFKLLEDLVLVENNELFEKRRKVKKIQGMIKKRVSKWLLLVNTFAMKKKELTVSKKKI